MRATRILLLALGLLVAAGAVAPQGAGQEPTPEVNATPPGLEESVDGSDFVGEGPENSWSTFAIVVGVLTGIVLVVLLGRRPPKDT